MENPACEELIPSGPGRRTAPSSWRHEFGHDASVRGYRNPLTCFDSTDVSAQVVFELSDTGLHRTNIATCGHRCKLRGQLRHASSRERRVVCSCSGTTRAKQDGDVEHAAHAC